MGLAIVGMHYTGMAAARFPEGSICGAVGSGGIDTRWLAVLVIVTTVATLGIALSRLAVRPADARAHRSAGRFAGARQRQADPGRAARPVDPAPNRMLLQDRIEQAIEKARRRNHAVAVMFCDLDGFKAVNDAYGHQLGDRLLVAVAQRIGGQLRPQDTLPASAAKSS